eukprot:gene21209-27474_t
MASSTDILNLIVLFVLWYGFNAGYNVYNSYVKNDLAFPFFVATIQLAVGLLYAIPLWVLGLRKSPRLSFSDIIKLFPIVALNAAGHLAAVTAMFEKGGGSFTHVIKASEPVVSVILGLLINGVVPKPLTALSLLPITYGVAYASTLGNLSVETMSKELTTKAAMLAMASNVAFALRSIFRKNLTSEFKTRTNLTPANEHAVTTILSTVILTFVFFGYENPQSITTRFEAIVDKNTFYKNIIFCGPVPTAVGNTLKRVVIFVALYYFTEGETFPLPKVIGCAIAIFGCLLFAVFDSKKL